MDYKRSNNYTKFHGTANSQEPFLRDFETIFGQSNSVHYATDIF